MKQFTLILTLMLIAFLLPACSQMPKSARNLNPQTGVEDILQQEMAKADNEKAAALQENTIPTAPIPVEPTPTPVPPKPAENPGRTDTETDVDVDLTKMSSTMVYSEVYAMMTDSKQYLGKTVRMRGEFSGFYDKYSDQYYFACLIRDAMACCAQGLEFVLTDDYSYPEDYPARGTEITVTGTFNSYQEGNFTFYHLSNAVLED